MNFQIFKTKCNTTEKVFISILTISLLFLSYKVFYNTITLQNILVYILLTILFLVLAFLAYFDFKKMEVHNVTSLSLMILLTLLNLILYLLFKNNTEIRVLGNWVYNPYDNMMGALILGCIFQLIVILSKEKALGQGDVRIALITGLLIGMSNLLLWSYLTVFTALIYGVVLVFKKKKFRNLRIPFLPFMIFSIFLIILSSL